MSNVVPTKPDATEIERMLITGDLAKLTPEQRLTYYNQVCQSLGLNPLTKPFDYIPLGGKLVLYARKDATEQLRKIHGVSITSVTSQRLEDVFVVTATATDRSGRTDAATGAVPIGNLKGEALANALMKAETKAKRRATLSICGLGMLDETETETMPMPVVLEAPPTPALPEAIPVGAYRILKVESREFGGVATLLDSDGTEDVYQVPYREDHERVEQHVQTGTLITAVRVKSRDGVKKIKQVAKWEPTASTPVEPVTPTQLTNDITVADIPF